jgi:hypothetical protein
MARVERAVRGGRVVDPAFARAGGVRVVEQPVCIEPARRQRERHERTRQPETERPHRTQSTDRTTFAA